MEDAILGNNRKLIANVLLYNEEERRYYMDFEDLEKKFEEERPAAMLLCSPHNPVGRAWTLEELERLSNLSRKYNVVIISDEIWADLVWPYPVSTTPPSSSSDASNPSSTPNRHTIFTSLPSNNDTSSFQ